MILNLLIVVGVILALDFYGYYGIRKLLSHESMRAYRKWIVRAYWLMDIAFLVFAFAWALIIRNSEWPDYVQYRNYFYITGAFILIFIPKIVFLVFNVLHDIYLFFSWIIRQAANSKTHSSARASALLRVGLVLSVFMFIWVFYGIVYGRFNFKVKEVEVAIDNLPDSFDGFRMIQFSDTHFGSFARYRPVERGIRKISETPHDVLLFTGDMVNNEAVEAEKFVELIAGVNSPEGKYSILGNHDMGDYRRWYTIEEKAANLQQLQENQENMGFKLLRNDHHFIVRGNDSIMIAGVDNWGKPPFAQLGDLDQARGEHKDFPYVVLLSHDPSHWTAEVVPQTNIMLTLAGHTHGMQAGIITPWFQWSPVMYKYPYWNGLYEQMGQYLHVNRGFGYLGFPGRMGMSPEITLLILRKAG